MLLLAAYQNKPDVGPGKRLGEHNIDVIRNDDGLFVGPKGEIGVGVIWCLKYLGEAAEGACE